MPAIQTTGSFISCTKTLEQHSGEVPFLFVIDKKKHSRFQRESIKRKEFDCFCRMAIPSFKRCFQLKKQHQKSHTIHAHMLTQRFTNAL